MTRNPASKHAIDLLKQLISVPSFSGQEQKAATLLVDALEREGVRVERYGNNIIARNREYDPSRPSILLNSHIDTVKPNDSWQRDPFSPSIENGRLYGLGSNDAGAALVCMVQAFLHFYSVENAGYNLVIAATAEEEISGAKGIESVLPHLGSIALAVVGEPTLLHLAVAEKGLMVLDCTVRGRAGHAAREEGDNAIYKALADLEWFRTFRFPRESSMLGPVKMTVSVIEAGTQHNVVPDVCRFVVDVRTTDAYTNAEVLDIVRAHVVADVVPRSTRLQPSGLPEGHALWQIARETGMQTVGSPTLSDQALLRCASVKTGPGDSARSHTADEYVELDEIEQGIDHYILLLSRLLQTTQ